MISFVIPTLNEASVIEATLQWIATYSGDKEIILSDGNSRDKTIEIARKFTDKIVVYDKPKRQTIGMARNMGATVAHGDFIVFVDADVIIFDPDEFFASALALFETTTNSVSLTAVIRVLPDTNTWADVIVFGCVNSLYFLLNNILHIGGASGEFQMVRKEAFIAVRGFDETLIAGEDHEHFRRLAKIGRTMFARHLSIYHTGRRAHKVGWVRLLCTWGVSFFPRPIRSLFIKEWKEVR